MKNPTETSPVKGLKAELRELRAEMKRRGVRKISCFNGGLTADESRFNTERFRLETEIAKATACNAPTL